MGAKADREQKKAETLANIFVVTSAINEIFQFDARKYFDQIGKRRA